MGAREDNDVTFEYASCFVCFKIPETNKVFGNLIGLVASQCYPLAGLNNCKVLLRVVLFANMRPNFTGEMKNGERIIPFSKKDKHLIIRHLQWQFALSILYILAAVLLFATFLLSYNHPAFKFLAGGSIACFTLMLILCQFDKRPNIAFRLFRDFLLGKKRVVYGAVEQIRFRQEDNKSPHQVYIVGAYRFELGQMSPALKKFRQVMPGQSVEIHQCLHSGMILQWEVME